MAQFCIGMGFLLFFLILPSHECPTSLDWVILWADTNKHCHAFLVNVLQDINSLQFLKRSWMKRPAISKENVNETVISIMCAFLKLYLLWYIWSCPCWGDTKLTIFTWRGIEGAELWLQSHVNTGNNTKYLNLAVPSEYRVWIMEGTIQAWLILYMFSRFWGISGPKVTRMIFCYNFGSKHTPST